MADTIRTAQYFKVEVPDKPGIGAGALTMLRDAGVNLLAFSAFPRGRRSQMDFVPSDPEAFKTAAKRAKWKLKAPNTCFLIEGDDRPGALVDILAQLAGAKINVTALDAVVAGSGRYGAIFWVKPRDVKKASKLLGAL